RAVQLGTVPLLTPGEALYFYGWLVFLVYLTLMRSPTQALVGALLVPFGAVCILLGAVAFPAEATVLPILRSPLFAVHTLSAFLGYSALSVACCAGILYLVLHDQVVHKRMGGLFRRLPPLEDLDQLGYRTVLLGFLFLTVAIVAGAIWARAEWGVSWVVEPKTVWALVSWGVYAVYLVVRGGRGWRGKRAAWLATAGFAFSIAGFLGTNYWLASGRHVF
ncbi:MAG TPA: cytochrome c biogenesis protein CcsA, partial [Solirubrobacterales bacterium]|nr:cytochrome c biogenesis protein CcsA [Solirubrobacterales bacterium]